MIERFFPDEEVRKVEDIKLEVLMRKNIKGLIIDIDNTLGEWRKEPSENVIRWLESLKTNGIKICLVSNNRRARVEMYSRRLMLHAIHGAFKPRRRAFISAMILMNTLPEETAVVGDQIFTDIYGGNRLNLYTIYVNPITDKDNLFVMMKRPLERFVLKKYKSIGDLKSITRLNWKEKSGKRKLRKLGRGNP